VGSHGRRHGTGRWSVSALRTTRVIGIDLSLTSTGVADIDDEGIRLHRIQSKGSKDATLLQRLDRAQTIVDSIGSVIGARGLREPGLFVVEGPSYGSITGSQHDRSGLWWLLVSFLLGGFEGRWRVAEVPPTTRARYATGRGNAAKDEVLAAVVRRYPEVEVTGNDTADSLVLAAMGARHLGTPIDQPPQTHLAAMDAVRWPVNQEGTPA